MSAAAADLARVQRRAVRALVERDLLVLRRSLGAFALRVLVQPVLFLFVFTYVFPKVGQAIGGPSSDRFAALLVPGTMAWVCMLQGVQAVALPLVADLAYTRQVEARAMAPVPARWLALVRLGTGALECLLAALVVVPFAYVIPPVPPDLDVAPPALVVTLVLGSLMSASLGLVLGTRIRPEQVSLLFSLVVVPMTFLGATYYPWAALDEVRWLQVVVLANPLVYLNEALRAATLPEIAHMPFDVAVGVMVVVTVALGRIGLGRFERLLVR